MWHVAYDVRCGPSHERKTMDVSCLVSFVAKGVMPLAVAPSGLSVHIVCRFPSWASPLLGCSRTRAVPDLHRPASRIGNRGTGRRGAVHLGVSLTFLAAQRVACWLAARQAGLTKRQRGLVFRHYYSVPTSATLAWSACHVGGYPARLRRILVCETTSLERASAGC